MKNKFKIAFVPNRSVQDEVATHLEDTLNAFDREGYDVAVEDRDGGGYMVHGRLLDQIGEAPTASNGPEVQLMVMSKAVLMLMMGMSEISKAAAKKEIPDIVKNMAKELSVDAMNKLIEDLKTFSADHNKKCPVKDCVVCTICDTAAETMKSYANLSLS